MNEQEKRSEVYSEKKFRISIAYPLRMPLIFTLFFAIIGIIIQSMQSGSLHVLSFFFSNYSAWFLSLGNFVEPALYDSVESVLRGLLSGWYYFFFTGGLLSLLWALLEWLFSLEIKSKTESKMK
jgi:hypothetical protein